MTTVQEFWGEAVTWEGTPFHWQGATKGLCADCKGPAYGTARDLGMPEALLPWGPMSDYGRVGYARRFQKGLRATLLRVNEFRLADLLLLYQGGEPQHLAIYGGDEVLTAYVSAGRVKRVSTAAALRLWPLHSIYRFRSLEAC